MTPLFSTSTINKISLDLAIPQEVVKKYFDHIGLFGEDVEELKCYISEASYGQYKSAEAFAEEMLDSFVDIDNEWWSAYIDYKRMGEDLLNYDYFAVAYGNYLWVFREN
jgi:hypothetical protein